MHWEFSAQIPFTSWLPAAMAAPTPVSSYISFESFLLTGFSTMSLPDSGSGIKIYVSFTVSVVGN